MPPTPPKEVDPSKSLPAMRLLSAAVLLVVAFSSASAFVPSALPQQQRDSNGRTRGVVSTCVYWTIGRLARFMCEPFASAAVGIGRFELCLTFLPRSVSFDAPLHTQVQAGLFDGLFGNGGPSQADLEKEEAYR